MHEMKVVKLGIGMHAPIMYVNSVLSLLITRLLTRSKNRIVHTKYK